MICPVCGVENDKYVCINCKTAILKRDLISVADIEEYSKNVNNKKSERSDDFIIENNVLVVYNGMDEIVMIPEGVEKIADGCFTRAKNDNIRIVYMPKSLKKINTDSCRETKNPANNGAFEMCDKIEKIVFPEGSQIDEIGNYAFYMCEKLKAIHGLENKKIYIGNNAFKGCNEKLIKKIGSLKQAEFSDYWSGGDE